MDDLPTAYVMVFALGTVVTLLAMLRVVQRLAARKSRQKDHAARRLLEVGQVVAVFMIAAAAVKNCLGGEDPLRDLVWVAAFALSGLALLLLSGELGVRMLMRSRLAAEIESGNAAAGLAAGAHYVATGIITSRAMAGHDLEGLGLSLVFFAIAQVTLHGFVALFRLLTVYDDAEQIEGENLAAAVSYAGITIAIAVIVARALEGDAFPGWLEALRGYGTVLLFLLALYPVRQLLVQTLLLGAPPRLRGGRLDTAIGAKRDHGMAALEATTYVATALAISQLL